MTEFEDAGVGLLVFFVILSVGIIVLDDFWWPFVFFAAVAAGFGTFIMSIRK